MSTCRSCRVWAGWWGICTPTTASRFASTAAVVPMTEAFLGEIDRFAEREGVEVVQFQKWQRKDDVTQEYLARFEGTEGSCISARRRRRRG